MKLLLYAWQANNERILAANLEKLGFEIIWFRKVCRHYTRDMELAAEMIPLIHREGIEAVISFNYFPIISALCHTSKIPYYAWVYDCPHFTLYAGQIMLPCNHIGIFDREMVGNLQEYGVRTVSHVPLGADPDLFASVIGEASPAEKEEYRCDISFVGSFYTDVHNYYDRFKAGAADDMKMRKAVQAWDAVIEKQCFAYEKDYLKEAVRSGETDLKPVEAMMKSRGLMLGEDYFAKAEDILLAAVLEKKVTVEERRLLMEKAAQRFGGRADLRLYTGSDLKSSSVLAKYSRGIVDYHTQMPLVFAGSRINLNLSLRSIHAGIPLRVLDIMACGGFVLTNMQPEISENFVDGQEVVMFRSLADCMDKIDYYLRHEEERAQIAAAGARKVREAFSYRTGLIKLLGG